jgi:hypothetical protein
MTPWLAEHDFLPFLETPGSAADCFAPDVLARLAAVRDQVDPDRRLVGAREIA